MTNRPIEEDAARNWRRMQERIDELESQLTIIIKVYSDATRPSPGNVPQVIYNTDDGNLNIDNGTNWILPDGTVT